MNSLICASTLIANIYFAHHAHNTHSYDYYALVFTEDLRKNIRRPIVCCAE